MKSLFHKFKIYSFIIFYSSLISIYFFEGYLNYKQYKNEKSKTEQFNDYDKRSKFQYYLDNKKFGFLPLISNMELYEDNDKILALSSFSKSKLVFCNESGMFSTYTSDRYGFNNNDDIYEEKIHNIFLGDSFTQGACVSRSDNIISNYSRISNQQSLNLGYSWSGPLNSYARLKEYIFPGTKNIFLLYFEGNDMEDLNSEISNGILIKYLKDDNFTQDLRNKQNIVNDLQYKFLKKKEKEFKNIKIKKNLIIDIILLRKIREYYLVKMNKNERNKIYLDEFEITINKIKKLAKKNNSNLYFVYLPEYHRFRPFYKKSNFAKILNVVNNLNINFINIASIMENEKDPLDFFHFRQNSHYTAQGYNFVANKIFDYVKNKE
tara:strand:+ start:42 stop:1175 length:1134 start_codon:yes stop_codon:yes gene_type:complete